MGIFDFLSEKKEKHSKPEELIFSIIKDLEEYLDIFSNYYANEELTQSDMFERLNEFRNYNAIVKTLLRVIRGTHETFKHDPELLLFNGVTQGIVSKQVLVALYKQIHENTENLKTFNREFNTHLKIKNNSNVIEVDFKKKQKVMKETSLKKAA